MEPRQPDLNTDRLTVVWAAAIPGIVQPTYPHIRPAFPHGAEEHPDPSVPQEKLWMEVLPEQVDPNRYPRSQAFYLSPEVFVGTIHQACVHFSRLLKAAAARGLQVDDEPSLARDAVWEANLDRQEQLARVPGVNDCYGVVMPMVANQSKVAQTYDKLREKYRLSRRAQEFAADLSQQEEEMEAITQQAAKALCAKVGDTKKVKQILDALVLVIPTENFSRLLHYVSRLTVPVPVPELAEEDEDECPA